MQTAWDRIEDDWHAYAPMAKAKWKRADPMIIDATGGRRDALIDAVERAYDISREQARREVSYWMTTAPHDRAAKADNLRAGRRRVERRTGQQRPRIDAAGQDRSTGAGWMEPVRDYALAPVDQVRQHPVGAMLVAVGVGLLITRFVAAGRR